MATFTNQTKNSSAYVNQSRSTTAAGYEFLIDSTYKLLIDGTYKFLIGGSASGSSTPWSNITKN